MRLLRESPCEKNPLLLPAGKRRNLAILKRREVHRLQCSLNRLLIAFRKTFPPPQTQIPTHLNNTANGGWKIPVDHLSLGQVSELLRSAAHALAVKKNTPALEIHQTGNRL